MNEHSSEHIQKQIKLYLIIGVALLVGTVVTVWAAHFKMEIVAGIVLAIIIATVKGGLVAGYFMHLSHERKLIYQVLLLTAVFIVVMVGIFLFAFHDQQGKHHGIFEVPVKHIIPAGAGHGAVEAGHHE